MIQVKEFGDKQFDTKEELFKALKENKSFLIAKKKAATKYADAFTFWPCVAEDRYTFGKGDEMKAYNPIDPTSVSELKMDLGINTTNLFDSHNDVHLPGLWNKSLKEKKELYLLKEHHMTFENIITDQVKGLAKYMEWKDLGAEYSGKTQVLVFRVKVDKGRHPFMFEQYAKGYVKNHSVGMRYVRLELAVNSDQEYFKEEKEVWDKYIDSVVNKEMAEAVGFFWAVHEAKVVEGSAVPLGSNWITPVIDMEGKSAGIATDPNTDAGQKTTSDLVREYYKNLL